jgi:hypothetical protein
MPARKSSNAHRIGELCVGGDWACAHGDIEALGFVAKELAVRGPAHLRTRLSELVEECAVDPNRAAADWPVLKALVARS